MNNYYKYNYTLINAICLPNFDIVCTFYNEDSELIFIKKGNFKFFIENQINLNAPGKELSDIKKWIHGKFNYLCIEWENGVSLGEDYLFEHTEQVF